MIFDILMHLKVWREFSIRASAPLVAIPDAVVDKHCQQENDHDLV
jgi:hypothetical protein